MNRIKEILQEKGIKQTWLAEKLGKSFNMINSYVQNRRQPSIKDLQRIAILLDVDFNTLLAFDQENSANSYSNRIANEELVHEEHAIYSSTVKIPLLGSVACGIPLLAEQNIDTYISVSKEIIKPNNTYFILRATGESMNEAGIKNGDLVLIKQQVTAKNGDKVVALIDDEATIKEFYQKDETVILFPRSTEKKYQPIILTQNFKIQGVVEKVISFETDSTN